MPPAHVVGATVVTRPSSHEVRGGARAAMFPHVAIESSGDRESSGRVFESGRVEAAVQIPLPARRPRFFARDFIEQE